MSENKRTTHVIDSLLLLHILLTAYRPPPGGGLLPYMGYIGMCGPKGYGFSAVLVINSVSILADFGHFGHNRVWCLYSTLIRVCS